MTLILNGTDNSATTPAVTGTDTDTGVYYPAANQIGLATDGALRLLLNASGQVIINNGSTVLDTALLTINCTAGTGSTIPLCLRAGVTTDGYGMVTFRNQAGSQGGITCNTSSISMSGLSGISFVGTQVASASANTLDDYEEGTFTPNLVNNGGTSTWGVKVGRYVKIGAQISFWCYFDAGGPGSGGALILSGLPFSGSGSGSTQSTVGTIITNLAGSSTSWYPAFQASVASDCVIWSGGSQVINPSINFSVVQGCYNAF